MKELKQKRKKTLWGIQMEDKEPYHTTVVPKLFPLGPTIVKKIKKKSKNDKKINKSCLLTHAYAYTSFSKKHLKSLI